MKRFLSVLLTTVLVLSVFVPMSITTVSAARVDQSNPAHLIMDFENGVVGNSDSDSDYTATIVDGAGASKSALKVTTSGTGAPSFTFGYRPGYSYTRNCYYDANGNVSETAKTETVTVERKYEFSAWIKVDSAPTSDTVELVYTFENPEKASYKNMNPTTVEKKITISSAGLKAGKWVKVKGEFLANPSETVTANFTYTQTYNLGIFGSYDRTENGKNTCAIPETGTIKAVVGGGMSYTIDDFVIMPSGAVYSYSNTPESVQIAEGLTRETEGYYKGQSQPLGGVGGGLNMYTFKGLTELTSTPNTDGWWVYDAEATLTAAPKDDSSTADVDERLAIDGVPNEWLSGNYATITANSKEGQLVCNDIDYRFGVQYYVYVWAKAENDIAKNARLQAVIDLDERTDTENIKSKYITAYATSIQPTSTASDVYLTDEWRRYTFAFKSTGVTFDEELADFSLKITNNGQTDADGNAIDLAGAQYSLGNIKFYQSGTPSVLNATGTMKAYPLGNNSYNVELDSHVETGNITNCLTRVMVPFNGDYVITKTFTNWKNAENFQITTDNIAGMKMVVTPRDRSNNYGVEYTAFTSQLNDYGLTAVAEFDQTIWASDMPKLTATIRYNAPSGGEILKALCGMYDENNKMVASDVKEFTLSAGEGSMNLSMDTEPTAVTAKVFLWEADTLAPRKDDVPVLTKTTDANFVYVDSEKGTNNTTYGYNNPLKTIAQVNTALTHLKNTSTKDTYVILMPGLHQVTSTFALSADNTSADYNTVFTSYNKNDKGVISGGTDLTGKFTHYEKGIYRAPVTLAEGRTSRQLYVDGVKGVRARSEGRLEGFTNTTVYNSGGYLDTLGVITATDTKYKDFEHVDDLEFIFYSLWTMGRCGVASITENKDGTISFNMDELGFKNLSNKGNTRAKIPAYIENAYELIDQGGEWYLDEEGGYIYYLPREGEDMSTAEVILPTFDNYFMADGPMISVTGTADAPARNVEFNGVEFSHTTWTRPSTEYGHADAQNNHIRESYRTDAPIGDRLVDGAIDVTYADNIDFLNCDFTRLGITALRILDGSDNCDVTGNEFYYISGSAVNIGDPYQGTYDKSSSSTKTDEKYILDNINVTNNYIHHVAHDFWSAAAISAGHPRNSTIMHNEICNIPYSGMHIGYGWSTVLSSTMTLKIENNYIHDLFQGNIYDGAAIYTIGGTGGTAENPCTLRGNYIENIGPGGATLYNDQGSRYWLVENNVSDISDSWGEYDLTTTLDPNAEDKYKGASNCMNINIDNNGVSHNLIWRNNYSSVNDIYLSTGAKNDASCQFEEPLGIDMSTGAWTAEAQAIIDNAGIQEEYRSNFEYGLRAILVPKAVTLSAGDTFTNAPCIITDKDTMYKSNALVVDVVSSNTAVATATADAIKAVGAGTATITYTVLENGIYRKATTVVTVK